MDQAPDLKRRILIIDDDELNSTSLAKRLERRGFTALVATSSKQGLALLEKQPFDLVLLDIVMPEIDGIATLKQIRAKYSPDELPVVMVTIINDSSEVFEAFELGANDYITKPVNIDAAAARIKGQLSSTELSIMRTNLKEIEAVNALVITYHHEINNPLTIAASELQDLSKQISNDERLPRAIAALDRIKSTLQTIKEIGHKKLTFDSYAGNSKKIKLT